MNAMSPLARHPMVEESLFRAIVKSWKYLAYAIKQFIILFPNLWASYERGRRKEEKLKNSVRETATSEEEKERLRLFNLESDHRSWTEMISNLASIEIEEVGPGQEVLEDILKIMFEIKGSQDKPEIVDTFFEC